MTVEGNSMTQQISHAEARMPEADGIFDADTLLDTLDERQAAALRQWLRLSSGETPPLRTALKPEEFLEALPVSTLVAVERDGADMVFRARIEGQMVQVAFGEARGRSFAEMYAPGHLAQVLPAFQETVKSGRVTLTPVATRTSDGEPFIYSRLLLPFADENGRVVRVFAVYGFDIERLRSLTEPLDIGDVIPAMNARRHSVGYVRLKTA